MMHGVMSLGAALSAPSRVGWHYNTCNGEGPDHRVISDTNPVPGCVTVQNGSGQTFPVDRGLIDKFAAPEGMIWNRDRQAFTKGPGDAR